MADKTIISVVPQDATFQIPGLWTESQVRTNYNDAIQGLSGMVATSTDATSAEGTTRTITFTQRTGQKG